MSSKQSNDTVTILIWVEEQRDINEVKKDVAKLGLESASICSPARLIIGNISREKIPNLKKSLKVMVEEFRIVEEV